MKKFIETLNNTNNVIAYETLPKGIFMGGEQTSQETLPAGTFRGGEQTSQETLPAGTFRGGW